MVSTFRLNTGELTPNFVLALQQGYPNKDIEILVREAPVSSPSNEADETDYLLASPANREHLLKVVADIERGEQLVSVPFEDMF
ncbi:MAG: hypothetical protein LBT13_09635 [Treponema sp.]|jgi:hypothetical protein|nr:hypothetical protein [Treponema sp.]